MNEQKTELEQRIEDGDRNAAALAGLLEYYKHKEKLTNPLGLRRQVWIPRLSRLLQDAGWTGMFAGWTNTHLHTDTSSK